jgi:hypothetical protein
MGIPKKKEDFGEGADLSLEVGSFGSHTRRGLSFEELARLQGVSPVEDPRDLLGGWPGDMDDGFEEAVSAWRRWDLSFQK